MEKRRTGKGERRTNGGGNGERMRRALKGGEVKGRIKGVTGKDGNGKKMRMGDERTNIGRGEGEGREGRTRTG